MPVNTCTNASLSIYSIRFGGHWPIGAIAVVIAPSREAAIEKFLEQLALEEPSLVSSNPKDSVCPALLAAVTGADLIVLTSNDTGCTILLNGEY